MSTTECTKEVTLIAGESLADMLGRALYINSSGRAVLADNSIDLPAVGVLAMNPGSSRIGTGTAGTGGAGEAVRVSQFQAGGKMVGVAAGAIAAGNLIVLAAPGTNGVDKGKFVAAADIAAIAANKLAYGVALEAASGDGKRFQFLAFVTAESDAA